MCTIDRCRKPAASNSRYCSMHRARISRHGSPDVVKKRKGSGDDVGYTTAHARVRRAKGSARSHDCIDCGGRACDWSYVGGAPDERVDPYRARSYSLSVEFYVPRCRGCHIRYDHPPTTVCVGAGHDLTISTNVGMTKAGRRYCAECHRVRQRVRWADRQAIADDRQARAEDDR